MVEKAREMDLYTYLSLYEPDELVHCSGSTYMTRTHDSLKISNGKWIWWSRGIGGYNALDYLIKVRDMPFAEAVERLCGTAGSVPPAPKPVKPAKKLLLLPEKNKNSDCVIGYLFGRGIDIEIIRECIRRGILYESARYHNAIFVGMDAAGTPRYAAYRGTGSRRIMGDAAGSDKHCSFRLEGSDRSAVHVFESAIDALSYATLLKLEGQDWKTVCLLSLAGVYAPRQSPEKSKVPAALEMYLSRNPMTEKICLHLDADLPGRMAANAIAAKLKDRFEVIDDPPSWGKDVNDFLCRKLRICRTKGRSFAR